jgi:hypothetical protein
MTKGDQPGLTLPRYRPYAPRTIRHHGLRELKQWRAKLYSVSEDGSEVDWVSFGPGVEMALSTLPAVAGERGRPGAAILIAHHARVGSYIVLGWWDRENELPVRVFVRAPGDHTWGAAADHQSFCVWDMHILWYERNAYVRTLLGLGDAAAAMRVYLDDQLQGPVMR